MFFTDIGITLRFNSLKEPFHSFCLSLGSHLHVLFSLFWFIFLSSLRAAPSYLIKFCIDGFCLNLNGLRKIHIIYLCAGFFSHIFGSIMCILLHVLINLLPLLPKKYSLAFKKYSLAFARKS